MGCDRLCVPFRGGTVHGGGYAGPFSWLCLTGWSNASWYIGGRPLFLAHNFTFYFSFSSISQIPLKFQQMLAPHIPHPLVKIQPENGTV